MKILVKTVLISVLISLPVTSFLQTFRTIFHHNSLPSLFCSVLPSFRIREPDIRRKTFPIWDEESACLQLPRNSRAVGLTKAVINMQLRPTRQRRTSTLQQRSGPNGSVFPTRYMKLNEDKEQVKEANVEFERVKITRKAGCYYGNASPCFQNADRIQIFLLIIQFSTEFIFSKYQNEPNCSNVCFIFFYFFLNIS